MALFRNRDQLASRGYAICTTPRSGSNFLCQLLASTGCLGRPLEYFNGPARRVLDDPDFPDVPAEQVERIRTAGATANGIYGLKLFPSQHDLIRPYIAWADALPGLRFVYLERRDVLGQAISWARAAQTGQYRSTQPQGGASAYDRDQIHARLLDILREQARWAAFFARTGTTPTQIVYEELFDNPKVEVRKIADLFDQAGAEIDLAKVAIKVQRDDTTEQWRKRFISEAGDRSYIDSL
jgi:LPS sulfotransferase NodH